MSIIIIVIIVVLIVVVVVVVVVRINNVCNLYFIQSEQVRYSRSYDLKLNKVVKNSLPLVIESPFK